MTAYINKLKDKTGNQQLPVTHERAVRDDNGTTLESKMQNLEGAMDKAYVASSDNGMGRITLKKNMVSGVNTLTQSMMQATNTIYVIQYDFTLGENITIPANCVLEFDGGSISGAHTITGNNTSIQAGLVKIFNTDITLAGTWDINSFYLEWAGAKTNDSTIDNAFAFVWVDTQLSTIKCPLIIHNLYISTPIVLTGEYDIICEGKIFYNGTKQATALTIGNEYVKYNKKYVISILQVSEPEQIIDNYGVRIKNVAVSTITINIISGFVYALWLNGDGNDKSISYDTFYINNIENCHLGILLKSTNGGHENENLFIGGRIRSNSGSVFRTLGTRGIRLEGVEHGCNNNIFIKPSLEGLNPCIELVRSVGNAFYNVRDENAPKLVEHDSYSKYNVIERYMEGAPRPNAFDGGNVVCSPWIIKDAALQSIFNDAIKRILYTNNGVKYIASNLHVMNLEEHRVYNGGAPSVRNSLPDDRLYQGLVIDTTKCKGFKASCYPASRIDIYILDDNGEYLDMTKTEDASTYMTYTGYSPVSYNFVTGRFLSLSNMQEVYLSFTDAVEKVFIGVNYTATHFSLDAFDNGYVGAGKASIVNKKTNVINGTINNQSGYNEGDKIFNETDNKSLFFNGTAWVDATGTQV